MPYNKRHFYILIKKENDIENNDVYDTIDELQKYLGNIFTNKNGNIDKKKYQLYSKIKINLEEDIIKNSIDKLLSIINTESKVYKI